jgi:type II secretory pathway component GspD/PulD (secretin)
MKIVRPLCLLAAAMLAPAASFCAEAPSQQQLPAAPLVLTPSTPQIPVFAGRDPDQIPATDALITQIIPLQYLASQDVLATLLPFLPAGTSVSANAGSNCIILTERAAVVKRFVTIVSLLDKSDGTVIELVQLQHADAAEAARLINAVLGEKHQ